MKTFRFNRRPLTLGRSIEQPSAADIKMTLGLVNASVEDALRYGGDITRAAIGAMNLRNDRKYIVVDVKTHMLMPGFYPAIPGWHTDSAPRDATGNPQGKGGPSLTLQEHIDAEGRGTHFHLLTTGQGCLTEFFTLRDVELTIPDGDTALYAAMSTAVEKWWRSDDTRQDFLTTPTATVIEWDWWDIHRGVAATKHEWRYLIRVTETDFLAPDTDLRRVIRTQQQVYAPPEFGW